MKEGDLEIPERSVRQGVRRAMRQWLPTSAQRRLQKKQNTRLRALQPVAVPLPQAANGESTSPEELREALANLKRFDAIVTLEHFGDPLLAEWLCTLLFRGPPPPGALAAIDSPPIKGQISFVGSPVKDNGRQKRASSAPAALQAELEARNAHDHVLYDYAHRRVTLALDCFRNSPRSYGAARSCFDIGADPPAVP
eukprot:CAMPEP_0185773532 /NCGR_PEP_ID=MMETSP1174-20130828/73968_1 /TAXON_ID=35687 /ORGANISM="Dictyocha speculum, Strain CCMP1381" /LENGTH=195 /DNA_ID=CAMNT_0028460273 /DNA_START=52 /DNA_END=641 /DNA_ORIENTATION=+